MNNHPEAKELIDIAKKNEMDKVHLVLKRYHDLGATPYYLSLCAGLLGLNTEETCRQIKKLGYPGWDRGRHSLKAKKLPKDDKIAIVKMLSLGYSISDMQKELNKDINSIIYFLCEDPDSCGQRKCMNCGEQIVWVRTEKRICDKCQRTANRVNTGAISSTDCVLHL